MRYITIAILLLLLTSCKITKYYSYESLKAPEIILPPDVKTIGFLDRNSHFDSDTTSQYFLYNGTTQKDSNNYDSVKVVNCHIGLNDNVSGILTDENIAFIQLQPKYLPGKRSLTPLSWQKADSICAKNNTDILICLENIQIFNQYDIFYESIEDEDDIYVGTSLIKYAAAWRIYDPFLRKYLDERVIIDSLYTTSEAYSKKALLKKIPSRQLLSADIAYEIGGDYAKRISPVWQNITRQYFVAGHRDFSVATYYMENKNLDKAMTVWQKIVSENKGKIAARAAFNLAFGYEIKEDYKQALHWIRKSAALYRELKKSPSELSIIKDYLKKLQQQAENHYRLNNFFGKNEN